MERWLRTKSVAVFKHCGPRPERDAFTLLVVAAVCSLNINAFSPAALMLRVRHWQIWEVVDVDVDNL